MTGMWGGEGEGGREGLLNQRTVMQAIIERGRTVLIL